jgi:hypothetical protein
LRLGFGHGRKARKIRWQQAAEKLEANGSFKNSLIVQSGVLKNYFFAIQHYYNNDNFKEKRQQTQAVSIVKSACLCDNAKP